MYDDVARVAAVVQVDAALGTPIIVRCVSQKGTATRLCMCADRICVLDSLFPVGDELPTLPPVSAFVYIAEILPLSSTSLQHLPGTTTT